MRHGSPMPENNLPTQDELEAMIGQTFAGVSFGDAVALIGEGVTWANARSEPALATLRGELEDTRRQRDEAIQHFQEEFDGHHRSRKKLGEAIAAERAARKEAERQRDEARRES